MNLYAILLTGLVAGGVSCAPDRNLQQILPAGGDTVIDLGTLETGMGMYTGRLTVTAGQPA